HIYFTQGVRFMSPFLFSCQFMSVNLLIYSQFIYITIFRRYVPHAGVVLIDQARHQIPTKHSEEMNLPHLRL
ncbi:hypothetical protein P4506_14435, partial [Geobacillus stearothermophilus]